MSGGRIRSVGFSTNTLNQGRRPSPRLPAFCSRASISFRVEPVYSSKLRMLANRGAYTANLARIIAPKKYIVIPNVATTVVLAENSMILPIKRHMTPAPAKTNWFAIYARNLLVSSRRLFKKLNSSAIFQSRFTAVSRFLAAQRLAANRSQRFIIATIPASTATMSRAVWTTTESIISDISPMSYHRCSRRRRSRCVTCRNH